MNTSNLCAIVIVTSSFVLTMPRTPLHFAPDQTSGEHPVRDITSFKIINAPATKTRKKGGFRFMKNTQKGVHKICTCLLRQQKNSSSLLKIVKGIFYTRKKKTALKITINCGLIPCKAPITV